MPSSPYGITGNNFNNVVSQVFILYSSSFVGALKNEIPGAALELYQLKLKQFSPDIPKFSTKHEDNPFTLNCFMVPRNCLFIFDAGSHRLGSNNFRSSSYKKARPVLPVFPDCLSVSYDYGYSRIFECFRYSE